MQVRCITLLCAAVLLALPALGACGKPSAGGGGGSAAMEPATTVDGAAPGDRPAPPDARRRREPPRDSGNVLSAGPTGLADCDRALDVVCRCAEKQASLQQPCKTLRTDAPAWKVRAKTQTTSQLEDLHQACRRILGSVTAAYGCK